MNMTIQSHTIINIETNFKSIKKRLKRFQYIFYKIIPWIECYIIKVKYINILNKKRKKIRGKIN